MDRVVRVSPVPGAFPGTARFEIRRQLGAGGTGVVYEAFDRERLAPVALKTLAAFTPDWVSLQFVPFANLINPDDLTTEVRFIAPGSDFHRLALDLGTRLPR